MVDIIREESTVTIAAVIYIVVAIIITIAVLIITMVTIMIIMDINIIDPLIMGKSIPVGVSLVANEKPKSLGDYPLNKDHRLFFLFTFIR